MVLNENLDVNRLDDTGRRAFLRAPEKVLLKPSTRLCKWSNRGLVGEHGISPWWSFVEAIRFPGGAITEGFRVSEERARRIGRTHREFARSRAAISEQFGNTMTRLIVVTLTGEAWALAGQASGQPEFAKARADLRNVYLTGGKRQPRALESPRSLVTGRLSRKPDATQVRKKASDPACQFRRTVEEAPWLRSQLSARDARIQRHVACTKRRGIPSVRRCKQK